MRSVEEVRVIWLGAHPMHPRVVEFVHAQILQSSGHEWIDANWQAIYAFYVEHGFLPGRVTLAIGRGIAVRN